MLKKRFLFFIMILFWLPQANATRIIPCRVVAISDGDTFRCLLENNKQIKVRLDSIDAPEKKQPFGNKSRQALANLIYKQFVQLQITGYDRYQRTLATVYNQQGQNVNLMMIKQGMAWVYARYAKDQHYFTAQQLARSQRIGLWQDPQPIPPEQWRKIQSEQRKQKRQQKEKGLFYGF
ncbi:thermonuclease family protein [Avibacterium sp. 20-15]|uniref:thermonuclease family protein n=1 Tax=unclassified Avibacterium TaxID=2685287 RepID=UPI00202723D3|nr:MULTISPECIES: thermonuclease family protein [unclassified Avibacterium]MCW9732009.1 thermonuclease family protein [Avibacterium sp. 20-15]URL04191.1 thermonuclease family protein [Avibacterium sp. 20-132]